MKDFSKCKESHCHPQKFYMRKNQGLDHENGSGEEILLCGVYLDGVFKLG